MRCMDHFLLGAVREAIGIPSVPYDLTRIKKLTRFDNPVDPYYVNLADWLKAEAGAFELLGEMPNLHTLLIASTSRLNGKLKVNDFSFLPHCKKLKRLDLTATNFSDCRLLLELPALASVTLPALSQLTHPEVLESAGLAGKVHISPEPFSETVFLKFPKSNLPPKEYAEAFLISSNGQNFNLENETRKQSAKKEPSAMMQKLVELYIKRTAQDAYALTIQPDKEPTIFDSKLGGLPYWPPEKSVPLDKDGHIMMLLAQIRFDHAGTDAPLPQKGMLQFFIPSEDDVFGASFGEGDGNFQVIYHDTVDETVTREQIAALGFPDCTDEEHVYYSPVFQECLLKMEKKPCIMPLGSNQSNVIVQEIAQELGVDLGKKSLIQAFSREEYNYLWDSIPSGGHWMLGYPYFTQYDPRDEDSPYDTLLLQIDTDGGDKVDYVMWGDSGVGNFFINHEKLAQLDFTDVLYTWDCC